MYWTLSLIWSLATTAALTKPLDTSGDHAFPIVNLNDAGRYRGTLENGTAGKALHTQNLLLESYLQSPLASMKDFEKAIALEFRAYISSFICTGDPNTAKLPTAPYWSHYGALGEFVNSPVRLVPQFAFKSNANKTFPTSTQLEVAQKAGIERIDFWQSSHILDSIRY